MELWQKAIEKFQLNFSVKIDKIEEQLEKLIKVYNLRSTNEAFFYFIKNEIGAELEKLGHDCSDFLAWLKIGKKEDADWYFYVFDSDEDYYDFKGNRKHIYDHVTYTSLLSFLELNSANHVADNLAKIKMEQNK